jgi:hypothetical protein
MSQYVPGAIDYVPVIQPYKPNLNFFQKVLETKQAQYDAGYNQLSSLYGSLLESPMLKSENIEARNKFFNDINSQITKISSLDLSRQENIDAASKVFQPLIDSDYIMKDMAFTKKYQEALDKHEYFKNCLDEKACNGKYWEEGARYVEYQAEDFINSSLDESLKFANPEYIPYTNSVKKAMELAKEMNFKMQSIQSSGGYNIITENGAEMTAPLASLLIDNFKYDGNVRKTYDVLSYLQRRDYAKEHASEFDGSEDQAERYYLNTMNEYLNADSEEAQKRALEKLELSKTRTAASLQIMESKGVDPNDPDDKKFIENTKQSITDQLILQGTADMMGEVKDITNPLSFGDSDIMAQRNRIDAANSYNLFTGGMIDAANQYATLTRKIVKYDADPYALASHTANLSLRNSLAVEDARFAHDVQLGVMKGDINLNPESSNEQLLPLEPGPTSTDPKGNTYEKEEKKQNLNVQSEAGMTQLLANQVHADLIAITQAKDGDKVNGIVVNEDVRQTARQELNLFKTADQNKADQNINTKVELNKNSGLQGYLEKTKDTSSEEPGFFKSFFGRVAQYFAGEIMDEPLPATISAISGPSKPLKQEFNTGQLNTQPGVNGYLNPDLSLGNMVENPNFYDPSSDMYYDNVKTRILSKLNDPGSLLNQLVDASGNRKYASAIEIMQKSSAEAQIQADRVGHNTSLIVSNNPVGLGIDINDASDPAVAQRMLGNIVVGPDGNKKIMPKEAWVAQYVKEQKVISNPGILDRLPYLFSERNAGYIPADPEDVREEASELYDTWVSLFKEEYDRGASALKPYAGFKPALALKVGPGGSGVQANPFMIQGIDTRYPAGGGAIGFTQTMDDLTRALSDPELKSKISVYGGDVAMATTTNFGISEPSYDILKALDFEMNKRNKSKSDPGMRFNMSTFPIAGGSTDFVGLKIELDPMMSHEEKGSSKSIGLTGESADGKSVLPVKTVSLIMPREAISKTNALFSALDETTDDRIMAAYGKLSIDYGPKIGNAMLTRSGTGYEYTYTEIMPDGTPVTTSDYLDGSTITPGQFANKVRMALGTPNVYGTAEQLRSPKMYDRASIEQLLGKN